MATRQGERARANLGRSAVAPKKAAKAAGSAAAKSNAKSLAKFAAHSATKPATKPATKSATTAASDLMTKSAKNNAGASKTKEQPAKQSSKSATKSLTEFSNKSPLASAAARTTEAHTEAHKARNSAAQKKGLASVATKTDSPTKPQHTEQLRNQLRSELRSERVVDEGGPRFSSAGERAEASSALTAHEATSASSRSTTATLPTMPDAASLMAAIRAANQATASVGRPSTPHAAGTEAAATESAATDATANATSAHNSAFSAWLGFWQDMMQRAAEFQSNFTSFGSAQSPGGFNAASMGLSSSMPAALASISLQPERLLELQREYIERLSSLWTDYIERPEKTTEPIKDTRFADAAWQKNSLASLTARAYLLNAEFLNRLADSIEADKKTKSRVKFAVGQMVDAAAPSNFLALNPKAQQRLQDTGGESLVQGLTNLLGDLQKGRITLSDERAFEVGRNVATSEGAVVYENRLMQLLQYKPLTTKVYARPFLLVPPCINKYYILDLQPENSLIRYMVQQGHTVFVVSWKNPHEAEASLGWDDYLNWGPIEAIHVAQQIAGSEQVNALGFCVGGTLLCAALAVLAARGERPVASLTLLTALLDFEDSGVLDVFIDENHVRMREETIGQSGLMPGRDLANTFSSLRANDLVWNYVVANYLEGKQPPAFDLLYWNGDSTNLPGPMYSWYLRNTYLENNFKVPGKLICCGKPVDLRQLTVPTYVFAAKEDHIVPWKAAYTSARLLPGTDGKGSSLRFVLGASGHIAGTVNSPSKNKRSFWVTQSTSSASPVAIDADTWLAQAEEKPGSWWTDFSHWLAAYGGPMKPAPSSYGNAQYQVIEPAPGRYVKEKA